MSADLQKRFSNNIVVIVVVLLGSLVLCGHSIAAPVLPVSGNSTPVTASPAHAAITTPLPGTGAPVEILKNMYPCIKGNAVIMEYIGECGIGTWREERMRSGSKVARLFPANSCGKQLVFFSTYTGERDDPNRVATIWILNASGTWSETMDPVYPDWWTYRIRGFLETAGRVPSVFVAGAVIALVLIGITFVLVERGKRSS